MDAEVIVHQPEKVGNLSPKSPNEIKEGNVKVEDKDAVSKLLPSEAKSENKAASLGPITPDSTKEGELLLDFTSPLSLISSPLKLTLSSNSLPNHDGYASPGRATSPQTPVNGVFDPFAPGSDKLLLAPKCKKYSEESRRHVARRLSFDPSLKFVLDGDSEKDADILKDDPIPDDEMLLETVYDNLLEVIVSKQTEIHVQESSPLEQCSDGLSTPKSVTVCDDLSEGIVSKETEDSPLDDGLMTPKSVTRLSWIADTCPGAPTKALKTRTRLRSIDQSLARKLEF